VGDYQSISFVNGEAHPAFAEASANSGNAFKESMFSPVNGLAEGLALYSADGDRPVPNAHSDHLPRTTPAIGR